MRSASTSDKASEVPLPSRWTLAQDTGSPSSAAALRELAESYWYCVYAWWRRAGLDAARTSTATLASFSRWLGDTPPKGTDTGSARLREWLPARLAELSSAGVKLNGEPALAIDPEWAEARYAGEPEGGPDAIFERRWALTVIEFTVGALQGEYAARGEEQLFDELLPFAGFEHADEERYSVAAARTGRTSGAMRKTVFDFRTRQREVLRSFVADTVADPADIESEITALLIACDAAGSAAATAPVPSVLRSVLPDQMLARAMHSVKMSSAGAHGWTPPSDAEITRLFPQYEMLGMLGRGGMGAVYRARQIELDRHVAIKLLPLEVSVDRDFADRFRREARAMAKLNHPNIIAVHDFGTTGEGHLFFAMEFVEGANLNDLIHGGEPLPPADALALAGQVCDALAYAHEQGIVHRDIKPANVMVDRRGRAKVADFGLARMAEADPAQWGSTMTGVVMGTPDYMSPEQKRGMHVDHRADIYSLGVMLYEMLCRETPQGAFELPSKRCGLDKRLDGIITKALAQQAGARFQSTAEMKTAIETVRPAVAKAQAKKGPAAKGAVPGGAPSPQFSVHPPIPSGAGKSKLSLYAGIAVALIAVVGGVLIFANTSKPKRSEIAKATSSITLIPVTATTSPQPAAAPAQRPIVNPPAARPAVAPIEAGAIKLAADKVPTRPGVRWENDTLRLDSAGVTFTEVVSRDVSLRAEVLMNPDIAAQRQLCVRLHQTPGGDFYCANLDAANRKVLLESVHLGKRTTLGDWPLPRTYAADEWALLELKAVGDEVSVSLDGRVLGTVHDTSHAEAGGVQVYAANGHFREIVYSPLDQAGSATAATKIPPLAKPVEVVPPTPMPEIPKPVTETPAPAVPAAQSASAKWLAEQEPQWQAAFAKEVTAPFEKGVADLKKQYLTAVEVQLAGATRTGKLDDAMAFRSERERLAGGSEMPAEDEALATATLKTLRASYRTAFTKIDADRFARAKIVHARYDAILGQSQTALTQRQRFDEALEIKARREVLSAAWLKPPAALAPVLAAAPATPKPALGQTMSAPPSKAPKLKPREIVERLLAMGATVSIGQPGAITKVEKLTQLPGEKFAIIQVEFAQHESLTEAGLGIAEQLVDADRLIFDGTPATDATIEKLRGLPLRSLALWNLPMLTEASCTSLAAMPALTSLSLKNTLGTGNLAALGKARRLENLGLEGASFSEADFTAIASIPALKSLSILTNEPVPLAAWARLVAAKKLTGLYLSNTTTDAAILREIGKLAGLEEIFTGYITSSETLAPLSALKSLRSLRTRVGSSLDGSVFATWPLRPAMRNLALDSTRSVNDDALRAIVAAFPKLDNLGVTANAGSVTAAGFANLTKLRQLGSLTLIGDAVDDAALEQIAKCDQLYHLNVANARATEAGAQLLTKLDNLRELSWFNPPVTDAALKSYGKMRALKEFKLAPETPPEIEQKLRAALPQVKVGR